MVDFSNMPSIYWTEQTKISYLQRRIIIYSIMYYEMNQNCIPDSEYDKISKQLLKMQSTVDFELLKGTQYFYCMYDFDGTTGYDLPYRLNKKDKDYLYHLAAHILKLQNGGY